MRFINVNELSVKTLLSKSVLMLTRYIPVKKRKLNFEQNIYINFLHPCMQYICVSSYISEAYSTQIIVVYFTDKYILIFVYERSEKVTFPCIKITLDRMCKVLKKRNIIYHSEDSSEHSINIFFKWCQ